VFHIANWPVFSPSAKKELESMLGTHTVVPLPAYDAEGNLISPREYRSKLKGALVAMRFDLTHWAFPARAGRPAADTFVANIRRIDMLEDPVAVSTAAKHVLDMFDPMPSARKRQKWKA
jgi:hypothetical protein